MEPDLPTAAEINIHDDFDEQWAVKNFLGRSLEEAQDLFAENFLFYSEDLMWMGPVAFCYYVRAAIAFLLSPSAKGHADSVGTFCMILEFRIGCKYWGIGNCSPLVRDGLEAMLRNFDHYECDPRLDGDVARRVEAVLARLKS